MATLVSSRPPRRGQQHSYSVRPPVRYPCTYRVYVDNVEMTTPGVSSAGGLRLVGLGADGTVTFEAQSDHPTGVVRVDVACPGRPTETLTLPASGAEPGGGIALDVNTVDFRAIRWPWWRRLLGYCPEVWITADGGRCEHIGDLNSIRTLVVNILECQYRCEDRIVTVKFVIVAGFVTSVRLL